MKINRDAFLSLFDASGEYRQRDGAVEVLIAEPTRQEWPARLVFRHGRCIRIEPVGEVPYRMADDTPLLPFAFTLVFPGDELLPVFLSEGSVLTRDTLHYDVHLMVVFDALESYGIRISPLARSALLTLPMPSRIDLYVRLLQIGRLPESERLAHLSRLPGTHEVYKLPIAKDLIALLTRTSIAPTVVEVSDILRESLLENLRSPVSVAS